MKDAEVEDTVNLNVTDAEDTSFNPNVKVNSNNSSDVAFGHGPGTGLPSKSNGGAGAGHRQRAQQDDNTIAKAKAALPKNAQVPADVIFGMARTPIYLDRSYEPPKVPSILQIENLKIGEISILLCLLPI